MAQWCSVAYVTCKSRVQSSLVSHGSVNRQDTSKLKSSIGENQDIHVHGYWFYHRNITELMNQTEPRSKLSILTPFFTAQSRLLTTLGKKPFENIVGKGENAGNQHFLLFQQRFLLHQRKIAPFQHHSNCRLQMLRIGHS